MTVSFVCVYFWATFPAGAKIATLLGPIRLQPAPVATPAVSHRHQHQHTITINGANCVEFGAKTVITQFLMNIQQLPSHALPLCTGRHTDTRLVLLSTWTVQLRLGLNLDINNYSKTVSFRFQQTVMQPQLVVWAGLPSLEPGVSCSRATGTTGAEQGSELLLFLLYYNDISCRNEVVFEVNR